jgi:hypothetical protein
MGTQYLIRKKGDSPLFLVMGIVMGTQYLFMLFFEKGAKQSPFAYKK